MSRWFRWYEGTTEDAKFRVIARDACGTVAGRSRDGSETAQDGSVTVRDVIALWAFILEDASKDDHRGICRRDVAFMEAVLDFREGVAARIVAAMTKVGMVAVDGPTVRVCHWGERQFETDASDPTGIERKRRYRRSQGGDQAGKSRANDGTPAGRSRDGNGTVAGRPEQNRAEQSRADFKERKNPLPLKERKRANGSTREARVWIVTDDPRWKRYAAAYSAEHGGKRPPTKGGLGGQGWYFPPLEGKR